MGSSTLTLFAGMFSVTRGCCRKQWLKSQGIYTGLKAFWDRWIESFICETVSASCSFFRKAVPSSWCLDGLYELDKGVPLVTAHSYPVSNISLCWGGQRGDGEKCYKGKWILVELAWCILLRLLYLGYSFLWSAPVQWPAQVAQGVLRSTQWAKSSEGWALKQKGRAFNLFRKSGTYVNTEESEASIEYS